MNKEISENENLLDRLVNRMMEEKNHNPRDYCFRYVVNRYPRQFMMPLIFQENM